ncbi:hypothetical protein ACP70R_009661 [Stipagrostis hirtigluma subsp. patula]
MAPSPWRRLPSPASVPAPRTSRATCRTASSRSTSCQAAQTSVLSRRGRHLWRAVPCVDIDHREFPAIAGTSAAPPSDMMGRYSRAVEESRIRECVRWDRFEDLTDRLTTHDASRPPLDAFRLRVAYEHFSAAHRWIRLGLERRPAAFHLRCDNGGHHVSFHDQWPWFSDLLLHRPHAVAYTSRLRTLHLAGMSLGAGLADALATDVPVLETLALRNCAFYGGSRSRKRKAGQEAYRNTDARTEVDRARVQSRPRRV